MEQEIDHSISSKDLFNQLRGIKGGEEDSVQILGAGAAYDPEAVISTGSITFDYATGRGGIKKGSLVHLFGPEGSGKTTVALHTIAQVHKKDPNAGVVYADSEYALVPEWMETIGVNTESMPVFYPDHQEDFINTAKHILQQTLDNPSMGNIPVMVLDSIASLHSKEMEESDAEDETSRAKEARVWSKHLNSIGKLYQRTGTIGIWTNQARDVQTAYTSEKFMYPGGRAIKHGMTLSVLFEGGTKSTGSEFETDKTTKTKTKILHGLRGEIKKNRMSGQLGGFFIRWRAGEPISMGWGLIDVIRQIENRDEMRARRSKNPEEFVSGIDTLPYAVGFSWDDKLGDFKSSQKYTSLRFDEDILDAILEDEPEFDPKDRGGKSFSKNEFIDFVDSHPALGELLREYVMETLNLDLSDEEIEEIASTNFDESGEEVDESEESDDDLGLNEEELDEDEEDEEDYDEEE